MYTRRQFLIGGFALYLSACGTSKRHAQISKGSLVSALGDSLTAGYGTTPNTAYPEVLAQLTGWQVQNDGVSGDQTGHILARLDSVLNKNPKLILLGIGGNDFLRRIPTEQTHKNLTQIITKIQRNNIPLVLIAEPHLTTGALITGQLSDHPIYAELAKQHKLPLFSDVWADILSDKTLKSDQIHANQTGYREFAEKLAKFLKKEGFLR